MGEIDFLAKSMADAYISNMDQTKKATLISDPKSFGEVYMQTFFAYKEQVSQKYKEINNPKEESATVKEAREIAARLFDDDNNVTINNSKTNENVREAQEIASRLFR